MKVLKFEDLNYDETTDAARKKADDFYDQLRDMPSDTFEKCIKAMLKKALEEARHARENFGPASPKSTTLSRAEIARRMAQNLKAAQKMLEVCAQSLERVVDIACMLSKTRDVTDPLYSDAVITAKALDGETQKVKQLADVCKDTLKVFKASGPKPK